jgi:hypothetical protein
MRKGLEEQIVETAADPLALSRAHDSQLEELQVSA